MTVRTPNYFHSHRKPVARGKGEGAARDGGAGEQAPAAPLPVPAVVPARRPWSIFNGGPAWPARRRPDDGL